VRDGGLLRGATSTFKRYDDEFLIEVLHRVCKKDYEYEREEAVRAVSARLGFATEAIRARMKSILNMSIRPGLLGYNGGCVAREVVSNHDTDPSRKDLKGASHATDRSAKG
jgi:hypothetical protein